MKERERWKLNWMKKNRWHKIKTCARCLGGLYPVENHDKLTKKEEELCQPKNGNWIKKTRQNKDTLCKV